MLSRTIETFELMVWQKRFPINFIITEQQKEEQLHTRQSNVDFSLVSGKILAAVIDLS